MAPAALRVPNPVHAPQIALTFPQSQPHIFVHEGARQTLERRLRAAFPGPVVEVHMSNIYRREAFRHHSFVSRVATGIVAGLGADGYELAVAAMRRLLDREK